MYSKLPFCLLAILFILTYSCVEDDICDQSNTTPRLFVKFTHTNPNDSTMIDTLDTFRLRNDSIQFVSRKIGVKEGDSLGLPLNIVSPDTTKFYLKVIQGNKSIVDTLNFTYQMDSKFAGKACGFIRTYKNLDFTLSKNYFEKGVLLDSILKDEIFSDLLLYY